MGAGGGGGGAVGGGGGAGPTGFTVGGAWLGKEGGSRVEVGGVDKG